MKLLKRIATRIKRAATVRATMYELSKLTNRDLKDIGVSRSDIKFIARKTANQQHNTMQYR